MEALYKSSQHCPVISSSTPSMLKAKAHLHDVTLAMPDRTMPRGGRNISASSCLSSSKTTPVSPHLKIQKVHSSPVLSFAEHRDLINSARTRFEINTRLETAFKQEMKIDQLLILEDLATDRGAILLTKDLLIKSQIMSALDLRNFESRLAENAGKIRLDQNNRKMHQRKFDYIEALGEVVHREMIKSDTGSDDTNGDVIQFNQEELQKFIMKHRGQKVLTVLKDINKDNPERSQHKHPHKLSDYQTAIQLIEFIRTPKSPDDQKKASAGTRGNSKETEGTPDKGKALERELHLVLHELHRKQTRMQRPESGPVPPLAVNAAKEPAQAPAKSKDIFDKLNIPGSLQDPEANMDLPRFVNQLQQTLSDTKQRRVLYFYHLAAEARMRVAQMEGYLVNTIRVNVYPRVALMLKENQYSPDKTSRQLTQEIAQKITLEVKKADVEVFCFKQYSASQKPADEDYRFRRYLDSNSR